jgi:hypothetical protein
VGEAVRAHRAAFPKAGNGRPPVGVERMPRIWVVKARKLIRLKTKRQIMDKALELLVRSESRKGILRFYGSGIWKGDLTASRRNRA